MPARISFEREGERQQEIGMRERKKEREQVGGSEKEKERKKTFSTESPRRLNKCPIDGYVHVSKKLDSCH